MKPALPWHFVTSEYPPDPGGVSDYAAQVACALAARGEEVHVWAPGEPGGSEVQDRVTVHRLKRGFSPLGLVELTRRADALPGCKRWFIHYVPQGFELKGANVPFAAWVTARPLSDQVWVLFHEVAVAWGSLKLSALSAIQRGMAALLAFRADTCCVSIPAWGALLPEHARLDLVWLPIPSNVPVRIPAGAAEEQRSVLRLQSTMLLGHFGTYGPWFRHTLAELLPTLLTDAPNRAALLLGRGSQHFAGELRAAHPALKEQIHAAGELDADELAVHIAACDVLLQPYPDGASSRRTSLMAGLALGRPVITNLGHLSDPLWRASSAVQLATGPSATALLAASRRLLGHPDRWVPLGTRAAALYEAEFSLDRLVGKLLKMAE